MLGGGGVRRALEVLSWQQRRGLQSGRREREAASLHFLGAVSGAGLVLAYATGHFKAALPPRPEQDDGDIYSASPGQSQSEDSRDFFAEAVAKAQPAAVSIRRMSADGKTHLATGSGSIVRPDGLILTNAHLIRTATALQVRLLDGREFPAKLCSVDQTSDLATLQIDAGAPLPSLKLADSDKARPGQLVAALGCPFQLPNSVTTGVISSPARRLTENPHWAKSETIRGTATPMAHHQYLQTDAALSPGNSGGPLVNLDGELLGVNTLSFRAKAGVGFAIPANSARRFLVKADAAAREKAAKLGVLGAELESLAQGLLLRSLRPDSLGLKAGLLPGDLITLLNRQPAHSHRLARTALGLSLLIWADVTFLILFRISRFG